MSMIGHGENDGAGKGRVRELMVMTGGGSGGHITPVLAVAHQVKLLAPNVAIAYIGQKGDGLADIPAADKNIDQVYEVRAGKFRRYHGESAIRQLLDIPTVFKNIRDAFYVLAGIIQSYRLLRRLRPQVVFVKGGFVGVPVGIAAGWLKIPIITHDSDAIPGLANRIVSRWAIIHAVALPKEVYHYPPDKTITVGVPIGHQFNVQTAEQQRLTRQRLGIGQDMQVILVTGGGLGAARLNQAVLAMAPDLLWSYGKVMIVHLTGRAHVDQIRKKYNETLTPEGSQRVQVEGFISNLYDYSSIASLVITRAGGTSMAEFAAQAKACVVVPNPQLTGGHQTKNAQVLADRGAIVLVTEKQLAKDQKALLPVVRQLLDNPEEAQSLGRDLQAIAQPEAAKKLGMLLLEQAKLASNH